MTRRGTAVAVVVAAGLTACGTTSPPGEELAAADLAVREADETEAGTHAPAPLRRARDKLGEARAAIARVRADERKAQEQIAALGDERRDIQLRARTRDAETARQAAAEAARQVEELKKRLQHLQAEQTERGLVLTLGDILFDVDEAELNPGGEQQIARVADFLRELPARDVLIEGHTDSMGKDAYNRELSQRRAAAIEDFLIRQGIDPRRIVSRGYGEEHPVASNESAAGRQQNRRIEIVILEAGAPVQIRPAAGPPRQ